MWGHSLHQDNPSVLNFKKTVPEPSPALKPNRTAQVRAGGEGMQMTLGKIRGGGQAPAAVTSDLPERSSWVHL